MSGHELELTTTSGPGDGVVRLPVPVPSVYGADLVNPDHGIAYLRLAAIRETTPRELDDAVLSLKARGARVLILDARGNVGGNFLAGVQVAQRFLPAGIVVTTQGQSPEFANRVFSSDSGMTAFDLPVVLLVDARTMSAAEAIAAAWKDHGRATLVGLPTFGKGTVQGQIRLSAADSPVGSRSGVLILTVAHMSGPRGVAVSSRVVPHILEADPVRQFELAIARAVELANGMR
jgi:C-terminal peptidase prc